MRYYIVIIKSIGNKNPSQIFEKLISEGVWLFKEENRNFTNEDYFIVYFAGKSFGYFGGSFQIEHKTENVSGECLKGYPSKYRITNIKEANSEVYVKDHINRLEFIGNKNSWGIYFRKPIKRIGYGDYSYILNLINTPRVI